MNKAPVVVLVCLALSAGACARTSPPEWGEQVPRSSAKNTSLVQALRATTSFDFVPADSPRDLADDADLTALLVVTGVQGVQVRNEGEATGGVVITTQVQDAYEGRAGVGDRVDIFLRWPDNLPLDAFERDLPSGTRLSFFGYQVERPVIGRAAAQALYEPAPQGLLIEEADGSLINVWAEEEFSPPAWEALTSVEAVPESLEDQS